MTENYFIQYLDIVLMSLSADIRINILVPHFVILTIVIKLTKNSSDFHFLKHKHFVIEYCLSTILLEE